MTGYIVEQSEERACKSKKWYPSRKAAKRYARLMRLHHQGERLSEYRCPFCGGYHIGHVNRTNTPKVMRPNVV